MIGFAILFFVLFILMFSIWWWDRLGVIFDTKDRKYFLGKTGMFCVENGYTLRRSYLDGALHGQWVNAIRVYRFESSANFDFDQTKKWGIQIGCRKFEGRNARVLRKWAKSYEG